MKFYISRWQYWWGYAVLSVLVIAAMWLTDRADDTAAWSVVGLALVLFIVLEVLVRRESVSFTGAGLEYQQKIISYHDIKSVSVSQSVFQYIMRYGDAKIKTETGEIVFRNFQDVRRIEKLIANRKGVNV